MISREGAKARRREDFKKEALHASFFFRPHPQSLPKTLFPRRLFSLSFLRAFAPSRLRVKNGGAWLLVAVCLWLTSGAALRAEDRTTVSPKSSFRVIQHSNVDEDGFLWTSSVKFTEKKKTAVKISEGLMWPALFFVSPDDRWLLQIQKTSSGENTAYLFRIEPNGRIWKMEETLTRLASDYVTRHLPEEKAGSMYHTGLVFGSWNLKAGILRFSYHGTSNSGGGLDRELAYNLNQHFITEP